MMHVATQDHKLLEMRRRLAEAEQGGGSERIRRQHQAGKLTARERIHRLLDPGSFVETDVLVTHRCHDFGMERKKIPGDGIVSGHGTIDGRLVFISAQDFTVFGGSVSETGAAKVCKIMDLAMDNGAPIITINDSGGARIQEGVGSLAGYAEIGKRNVEASGVVPQISLILGPCAGGAVYSPAMTDFIFMVDDTSYMFLTGPEVIRKATHEEVTKEELGGCETHVTKSGVVHFRMPDEPSCLEGVRELLSYLPSNNMDDPPPGTSDDNPMRQDESLNHFLPPRDKSYDVRELIAIIVDDGRFLEVHREYARNVVVGFARFGNHAVGIVASQPAHLAGVLDIDASVKAARFVRFCDAFSLPLVTLVDVPGYLPGTRQELGGIIRHGAKLVYAYVEATVPQITVVLRKAYGGAYAALGSKHLSADLNLAYPTAEIAVMGPETGVDVLFRSELQQAGEGAAELRARKVEEYAQRFASPYLAAERGFIDAVIMPQETRPHIVRGLRMLAGKRVNHRPRKHGNIPL